MKFEVGSHHQNRNGFYVVVAINGKNAVIRYHNGTEVTADKDVLIRVERMLYGEQTVEERERMEFAEACAYLKSEGLDYDPNDQLDTYKKANQHREAKRLVELHSKFLIMRGINTSGRSIYQVADDILVKRRTPACFHCKRDLDNLVNMECKACGWIMCPSCGACGCGYKK